MPTHNHVGVIVQSTGAIVGDDGWRGGASGICKAAELEHLPKDPDVAIEPARLWPLVDEFAQDMHAARREPAK